VKRIKYLLCARPQYGANEAADSDDPARPRFVRITDIDTNDNLDLVANTQPSQAARIRGSVGLNFGTRALSDVSTWPVDKFIPDAMWQEAVDIFAFDALIQNPDRRFSNPNLFTRGDSLLIFDHETAFSFLVALFPSATP